jgi:hypothetical protein
MLATVDSSPEDLGAEDRAHEQRWWISRFSRDQERRLYFLATMVVAVWYLMTRVL